MQYILNEEEMKALNSRETKEMTQRREKDAIAVFQVFLEEVGCRKAHDYCDECPLLNLDTICTRDKDVSQ